MTFWWGINVHFNDLCYLSVTKYKHISKLDKHQLCRIFVGHQPNFPISYRVSYVCHIHKHNKPNPNSTTLCVAYWIYLNLDFFAKLKFSEMHSRTCTNNSDTANTIVQYKLYTFYTFTKLSHRIVHHLFAFHKNYFHKFWNWAVSERNSHRLRT